MNGKKGSIEIDIPADNAGNTKDKQKHGCSNNGGLSSRISSVWKFCNDDVNRVIFSFKVGLAVLLVSLLVLFRAPFELLGTNIIWSIITVAIMFEYTVGMTFNRGFNRALGSLLAGILAIAIIQLALCTGRIAEPILIGASIFLMGAITSFMKQWPTLVPYEYGFRVVLFTFCMIIASGYRMGNPIRTSMERLYSIAIGGFVAVLVNALIFPIWAGEQLHKELVNGFEAVADSLEECVGKYLEDEGSDGSEFSTAVIDEFPDEPAYKRCRNTLNTSSKLESLANSAKWEPPHGRFKHFFYPWSEYVKVGAVLRYCAYEVMALHGVLHSEIQAPHNLRITFKSEIREATSQAAELVRSLGKDINSMKRGLQTTLLKRVHSSTERLQCAVDNHSYLLTSAFEPLPDAAKKPSVPKISHALSNDLSSQLNDLNSNQAPAETTPPPCPLSQPPQETYHEMMRRQSRRLHSWPSREFDAFGEEGGGGNMELPPRMRALESTAALSLATFASLLIEFVARLDHLVESVDRLARLAEFKHEGL
ncbi:hypothetical protein Nepgr_028552 [Nepenthes gracilis]|uniref:Aluminum-activated malate transporter 9 n=1 Tax=Nepenthes gracilis TaxID=150966 RepID=A0AAD3TCH2_NEPGR|nr:hypothetical protein Nepgr_028552 [Nepenthes gracilis]